MGFEAIATVSPKPGKEDRVREGLKELSGQVQANEQNTVRYQVYEQTNAQGPPDFVIIEDYADQAAYDYHRATEYVQLLFKAIKEEDLLAKPVEVKTVNKLSGFWGR